MPLKDPEARKAYERARYARQQVTLRAKGRAYHTAHREAVNAKKRANRAANPEYYRAQQRASREKQREERNAKRRAKYAANPVPYRVKIYAYNAAHREERLQRQREAYAANVEEKRRQARESHQRHAAKKQARGRAYHATHREELNAKKRAHRAANPAHYRAQARAHREATRHKEQTRRALKNGAPLRDLSLQQWREIQALYQYRCVYCGKQPTHLTMDHLIPLSRGGSHTASNIVPACRSCNASKQAGPPRVPVQPVLLTIAAPVKKRRKTS